MAMAEEFRADGIAFNGLWPRTMVATSIVKSFGEAMFSHSRIPEIVADAAYIILNRPARVCTGPVLHR